MPYYFVNGCPLADPDGSGNDAKCWCSAKSWNADKNKCWGSIPEEALEKFRQEHLNRTGFHKWMESAAKEKVMERAAPRARTSRSAHPSPAWTAEAFMIRNWPLRVSPAHVSI